MTSKAMAFATMLALCAVSGSVRAETGPWPTALSEGSDCAAWTISAKKTDVARLADKKHCDESNQGDLSKQQICMANLQSQEQVEFFSNRCGDGYVVSLNGQQFALKRLSPTARKPPFLTGRYAGDGIRLYVESPRLLSKEYEEGEPHTEANVFSARYAVKVRVEQRQHMNRFPGEVWYGL